MGQKQSSNKEKQSSNKETLAAIFDRQINEMRAVETQQQFNDTLERHMSERPILTQKEMKNYANLIYLYELAVKKKKKELVEKYGAELVENRGPNVVGKLRF